MKTASAMNTPASSGKRSLILATLGAALAIHGVGCATIVKGKSQTVSIDSNVKGAEIVIDGTVVGSTPYTGSITRGSSTSLTVRKPGYRSKTIVLNSDVEPIFWGNVISGGFLGSSTDAGTGAMYKYSPSNIEVDLQPEGK